MYQESGTNHSYEEMMSAQLPDTSTAETEVRATETPGPGMLWQIINYDQNLGRRMHTMNKNYPALRVLSECFSFSVDESLWIGFSCALGFLLCCSRGFGQWGPIGCVEEALWDCYGACAVGTTVESLLKLSFRRTRPDYEKQSRHIVIVGELYSFPSGHSQRAFYFIFYLSRSRFVHLLRPIFFAPLAFSCIPWAIMVAWSRVAKGRHFPLDVFVGALVGTFLGYFVEDYCSGYARASIKVVTGVFATGNWVYYMFIPLFDGHSKALLFALAIFFFFAGNLFYSSVIAVDTELAGAQSIRPVERLEDDNHWFGAYECVRYW